MEMVCLPIIGYKRKHSYGFSLIQVGCRLWNLSVVSVFVFTLCNILIAIRLFNSTCKCSFQDSDSDSDAESYSRTRKNQQLFLERSTTKKTPFPEPPASQKPANIFHIVSQLGRWDASRMYKIFDAALIGDEYVHLSASYSVCLATQSSVEKLGSLAQVAHHWTGPISVALFAAGDEEYALIQGFVEYLRRCFPSIHDRAAFHLLFPGNKVPTKLGASTIDNVNCLRPEKQLATMLKTRSNDLKSWRIRNPYPQNIMRNLARKNCQTDFVFLTDVDIIPSVDLAEGLDNFLKTSETKSCQKCAYVIPTYEIDNRVHFPKGKADLVRLTKKGLAQPFHHKVFIFNQFATNFTRWENENNDRHDVHVSHDVTNFEFLYEPFYVASDKVPPHNERFIGYGYTRNTQVYEMFVGGYEFKVLSPIFTCHWGLEKKHRWPPWRERQNYANRANFEEFKREIYARYQRDPLNMIKNKTPTASRTLVSKLRKS